MSTSLSKSLVGNKKDTSGQNKPQVNQSSLSTENEIKKITHWLNATSPFVSKLQNQEDKKRATYFKESLEKKL